MKMYVHWTLTNINRKDVHASMISFNGKDMNRVLRIRVYSTVLKKMKPQLFFIFFLKKTFSSFYTTDDNKAYTCLCLSKSDAFERIKNAKCESSLRCLT